MTRYSIEPRTRKYIKENGFWSVTRNLSNKYGKQLLDTLLNVLKTGSKKVVHRATKATGEFIGDRIADKIVKTKPLPAENSRNFEEIFIPPAKREEIHHRISKVLNDSTVSKFVIRKCIEISNFQETNIFSIKI